uniref:Uncharacterized protein n=1 Tax=Oryza glumipatula TaxID=40148 RepID=A0A0D9Y6A9_9ORYZ
MERIEESLRGREHDQERTWRGKRGRMGTGESGQARTKSSTRRSVAGRASSPTPESKRATQCSAACSPNFRRAASSSPRCSAMGVTGNSTSTFLALAAAAASDLGEATSRARNSPISFCFAEQMRWRRQPRTVRRQSAAGTQTTARTTSSTTVKRKQQQTADGAFLLIRPRRWPIRLLPPRPRAGLSHAVAAGGAPLPATAVAGEATLADNADDEARVLLPRARSRRRRQG